MLRRLLHIALAFYLAAVSLAVAQEDDRGWLTNLLEESLGGEGRTVLITGFRGALSSEATIDRITIADPDGIWLTMQDLVLQWNRSALLRGRIDIDRLAAGSIELARLPVAPERTLPAAEATPFSLPELPVAIEIRALEAEEIRVGAPVLGEDIALTLAASAVLVDGSGTAQLTATRRDGKRGVFEIDASYARDTEALGLQINLDEGADGIAARLIDLPGRPSIALSVDGQGTLDDFDTEISLSSDGEERLSGQVRLLAEPADVEGADPVRRFEASLGGDVTALFAPQYRSFFGPEVRLDLAGRRDDDGGLDLSRLSLVAQALQLDGSVSLNSDFWPTRIDIDGTLAADEPVLLPLRGEETRVTRADLSISHDAGQSDRWTGKLRVQGLERREARIDEVRLVSGGTLEGTVGNLGLVTANVDFVAEGVALSDPGLAEAVGRDLEGSFDVTYAEDSPVELSNVDIRTTAARLSGNATIDALETGFSTNLNTRLVARELQRFSTLAGRDLSGSAELAVDGQVALGGLFDLVITGQTQDLRIAQQQADAVLQGVTRLDVAVRRDAEGIVLERAQITNPQIDLSADGRFTTGNSEARFDLRLADAALIEPRFPGALNIRGTATEDGSGWSVDTDLDGPLGLTAQVSGQVTGESPALRYSARIPDISPLVAEIRGPLALDGTARLDNGAWRIDTSVAGPAGTRAQVDGTIATGGRLDLAASGTAPLGLSEPFLQPRSLQGDAQFDLRINGQPSLEAVSGTITTSNGRFSAPNVRIALTGINARINVQSGRASVDAQSAVSTGGQVSVRGPIGLGNGFPANLDVTLTQVQVVDPTLYETVVNGTIAVRGPLRGGGTISGDLAVGETEIIVPSSGVTNFAIVPEIVHVGASPAAAKTLVKAGFDRDSTERDTATRTRFGLNITISAPSRIFVRGRGLEAELGGRVRLTGSTENVITAGRFDLIRGRLDVLDQRFQLDSGSIQLQGDFDPFLRFVATTPTSDGTASVIIEGRASEPQVRFDATPDAPQDEILAQIFFRRDVEQLSAFQALQLANAVATLAGTGGESIVSRLRRSFALDDLDITTDDDGNTAVRVGKYLTDNVYTDVTAGANGTGEVSLNIDLTPSLTARGALGQDGNSSLGIFYERDY